MRTDGMKESDEARKGGKRKSDAERTLTPARLNPPVPSTIPSAAQSTEGPPQNVT